MSKLHYTELFYSIQGEGRYMGVPSIFLRTFGCNFKCRNFGRDKDDTSDNQEVMNIIQNIEKYDTFNNLPLVSTGCDSYSSVYPQFKSFVTHSDTNDIVNRIVDILPKGRWIDEHLVITGGEPLLGWQKSYPELLMHTKMLALKELTFETNGTQKLTDEFSSWLYNEWTNEKGYFSLTFSVSPKLPISGENWKDAIRPEVVAQYNEYGYTYLKFVLSSLEDIDHAVEAYNLYKKEGFDGPVYLMPVGGVEGVYNLNSRRVAEMALKLGWRYSDRLQVPLFKNAWNT